MAHAYYHALSSVKRHGGKVEDYLALHGFMDATKMHTADPRHRFFLHNSWGIFLMERLVGVTYQLPSTGAHVPTRVLLERHVQEDLRILPTLETWLRLTPTYEIAETDTVYAHCLHSVQCFGGDWKDYRALHTLMNSVQRVLADSRSLLVLHNAWGVTLLEEMYGNTFTRLSDGWRMTSREVLEAHVRRDCGGSVPTVEQCIQQIPMQGWMYQRAEQLSRQFATLKHDIHERISDDIERGPTIATRAVGDVYRTSTAITRLEPHA